VFPLGNLGPGRVGREATALDPSVVENDVYRPPRTGPGLHVGSRRGGPRSRGSRAPRPARATSSCSRPRSPGTGMERPTSHVPPSNSCPGKVGRPVLTDARFSGRLDRRVHRATLSRRLSRAGDRPPCATGDVVEITIDRRLTRGASTSWGTAEGRFPRRGRDLLACAPRSLASPPAPTPADTRVWAALQEASGGIWAGAVYDADRIALASRVRLLPLPRSKKPR